MYYETDKKKILLKARNFVHNGERRVEAKSGRAIKRTPERKKFLRDFIQTIYDRLSVPNHECYYCGAELKSYQECSLDHKDPLDGKLTHIPENVEICCFRCNKLKQDMTVEEFVQKYPSRTLPLQKRLYGQFEDSESKT